MQNEFDLTFSVAVLHYNAQTSSKDVLQKLRQFCSITTDTSGRTMASTTTTSSSSSLSTFRLCRRWHLRPPWDVIPLRHD